MQLTILGAGIAGLSAAIALERAGHDVTVFEASPVVTGAGAGIILAPNAMHVSRRLSLQDDVLANGRQLSSFAIATSEGRILSQTDGSQIMRRYGITNVAIHRRDLHAALIAALGRTHVEFTKRAVNLEQADATVTVQFADGTRHRCSAVVVADGIHSTIRRQLVAGSTERYAGYTCWRAVVRTDHALDLKGATETWGTRGRFGIVPLRGDAVYWFACVNAPAHDTTIKASRIADLHDRFARYHAPIPSLVAATPNADLLRNDVTDLARPERFGFGRVVLIGDAAHAATPNLGQGASQAIEDAWMLAATLGEHREPAAAFRAFEQRRLGRTRFIVAQSWRLGKLAQWEHPVACALRNLALRLAPAWTHANALRKLYAPL